MLIDEADRVLAGALSLLDEVDRHPDGAQLLNRRPAPTANPVGWLLWHIGRVQDAQVAPLADRPEAWVAGGYADSFALPLPVEATGFGQDAAEVDAVVVRPAELRAYLTTCHDDLVDHLRRVGADAQTQLNRVIDTDWDPPVTQGVRLISIVDDVTQHLGQADYAWGIVTGSDHTGPA